MTLTPGTRFGPYEIIAPIGMREVYKERDIKLKREVALNSKEIAAARIPRIPASCSAVAALTFLICAMAGTAAAQWLSIPLPGTPRTPDGKPNLNAATPRAADGKADLSGIWRAD
ncbi:MAG TPA: hypothetical protein VGV35_03170, partial [Bryobacteraceae bacterium]|nr:hypothetical protein [Bryobacteraceae bacterium]